MHAYDAPPPRRSAFASVPSARSGESPVASSATPIYDSLYAEWVKAFRTLPGDRSGEEELGFTAFGTAPHSTGSYRVTSYSAYSAGAYSARQSGGQQQPQWQRVGTLGRQQDTGMHHVPAGLPPAPRRGA
ncbi:hypothetical protein ACWER6_30905 [Streptomyces sp. NPDC004009]